MDIPRSLQWKTVVPAMCLPFIASLFYFVLFSEYAFSRAIYGATKVFTLVWPVVAFLLIYKTGLPKLRLRDRIHLNAIPLGLLSGLGIVGLMFLLMQTPLGQIVREGGDNIGKKTRELGVLDHFWIFAFFISILHSLLEEYYWRWFVYGRLRGLLPRWPAHLRAGATFAAHHIVITTQFFPFGWGLFFGCMVGVGGVIFSLLYERQRSLVGAWFAHMCVDFGIMAIGYNVIT